MVDEKTTVVLGDEYDDVLRDALRVVLIKNGAVGIESSWGIGGSQEVETLQIRLGEDSLTIEAETFVGLMLTGPNSIVERLARQVHQQMKGT